MLDYLKALLSLDRETTSKDAGQARAPETLMVDGLEPLAFARHLKTHHGFPIVDWAVVDEWVRTALTEKKQSAAWTACERAWLLHFRDALGPEFRVDEGETAMILSSLGRGESGSMLEYMQRTLRRIGAVLHGIAQAPEWGKDLLIVLDDQKQYYDYVSHYYPDSGEFAFSGGMHINAGCSHFVTVKSDVQSLEPTIAHEMTHGCLAHLPIPAWLNEGIAVNTEHRLAGAGKPLYTPEQMHAKHLKFWGAPEIQQFWSGKSFLRPDEGNMLSYDLARILVEHFSRDWDAFAGFVRSANLEDAGNGPARKHLGLSLGAAVTAVLELAPSPDWEPDPASWSGEAERGAFTLRVRPRTKGW